MATVNKNFRIKHGLVVEGTTGTINGENILTETGSDQYILDLVGGANLIDSVNSAQLEIVNGELSVKSGVFDADGAAATAESNANDYTDTALESYTPTSSLETTLDGYGYLKSDDLPTMYSDSDVDAHLSGTNGITYSSGTISANVGNGITTENINAVPHIVVDRTTVDAWYDANGAASTAQSNAEDYTDNALESYTLTEDLDATVDGYGYLKSADLSSYATQTYADDAADTAESNANTYTNNLIGDVTVDGTAGNTVTDRIATAVSDLVGSAPELLDTLQELAAAIDNDPETINNLQSLAAGKQDALTAGSNIDITDDVISVTGLDSADISDFNTAALSATSEAYDPAGAAADAENNASAYADDIVSDVLDATTPFTAINVNDQAKQIAATATITTGSASTVYQWAKADYRSAKLLVKIDNGTHNEISEILVTLDSSDNVAITEYAIVGTNGSRGTISAVVSGSNVTVTVNPTDNSTVKVTGTLLK